jgi:outer membrane protein
MRAKRTPDSFVTSNGGNACTRLALLAALVLSGCEDVMSRDATVALREQIIEAQRRQIEAAGTGQPRITTPALIDSYLEKEPQRLEQLDRISGPQLHRDSPLEHGLGLDGEPSAVAAMSLQQALRTALRNNLDVAQASLQPAISEAEVVFAEAAFDAVYFLDAEFLKSDRPQQTTVISGTPVNTGLRSGQNLSLETGIRKPLQSGGQLTASTGFEFNNSTSPGIALTPDPAWTSNVLLGIQQPLLRNFGSEVNRAQIAINRNAHRRDVMRLHVQLLNTLAEVEEAYWQLVFARFNLAIQQDLTQQTIEVRNTLFARVDFDVTAIQRAQAQNFVERRRGDLISARRAVRQASDRLKRLLNDPALPLTDETLIVPLDEPVIAPVEFNLMDAATTALRQRPETRSALLDIDDASIRQLVADNQRLPSLNLNAQVQYFGLNAEGERLDDSYRRLGESDFIEYLIGGQFEMPIGNRQAEARYRRTRIEGQAAVIAYQRAVQEIIASLKDALNEQQAAYALIGLTRSERRTAAENLRAIRERENIIEGLSPEFLLDLKLNAQSRLAEAQQREIQAMVNYNVAVMRVRQATGTLLEFNQVQMVWPPGVFDDERR